jgi:hypothetical protein
MIAYLGGIFYPHPPTSSMRTRANPPAKEVHQRLVSKYGKAKALSIIAQKLGRTVYSMLKHRRPFDPQKFFQS